MQSGSTPQVKDYFADLQTPSMNDMQLQLEELVQQGSLSPEQAQAFMQDPSAMNGIQNNPEYEKAQMDALLGLQDVSDSGGMTLTDKANLNRIASEEGARSRGNRDAILQNAQARGVGGSGLEIMAQLQNEQDQATRASQRDLDVAGMAQQRALDALMQGGRLAGDIRGQGFNEQSQIAQANDAISRFNTQNSQNVNMQNVQANNAAQAANLGMKQDIANSNVSTRNNQQVHNKGLHQQNYENELKKRGGQSGVAMSNAENAGRDSAGRAAANNQMIGIGATVAGTMMGGPAGGAAAKLATKDIAGEPETFNQDQLRGWKKSKDGGLVHGEPSDHDTQRYLLQPGEFVVPKDKVPEVLKNACTDDKGEFDAAQFLDMMTGNRYNYGSKKRKS